jgi:alanyl-tRNA synthetase
VLNVSKGEKDGEWAVILDKTIFHPQGGGQPQDDGEIRADEAVFVVTGLKAKDDCIIHTGNFSKVRKSRLIR